MSLRVRILKNGCFLCDEKNRFSMPKIQLFQYFLPFLDYKIVSEEEKADICLFSIGLENKELLRDDEVNIMICIENMTKWGWYKHYNKYGEYGNEKIDIYIYNHISKIFKTEKYISIPTAYLRINYYKQFSDYFRNIFKCPFENKKFCLFIGKDTLNYNKKIVMINKMSLLGKVDFIHQYNSEIEFETCYNSLKLLNIFNQYKFIICFENSYNEGYITEKIFNCFFAKAIPIYSGCLKIENFINGNSFINVKEDEVESFDLSKIKKLNCDKKAYIEMIETEKISSYFSDENCLEEMKSFIYKKLKI